MKTIDRIFEYLDDKGLKPAQVEKEIGLGNGTLAKAQGRGGNIRADVIEKFVSFYNEINVDWLITGKGDMISNSQTNNQNDPKMDCGKCPYKEMYQKLIKDSDWYQNEIDRLNRKLDDLPNQNQPERKRKAG